MLFLFPIMGFLILDLYFNLLPNLIPPGTASWLLYAAFFFVLARHVARLTGLEGLEDLGLRAHYGWKRNLKIGFAFGAAVWGSMYVLLGVLGDFRVTGFKQPQEAAVFVAEMLVVLFLGSLINDLIVRGYLFAQLRDKLPGAALIMLSSFIYALDDVWLAGFDIRSAYVSVLLGLSLGYTLYRTGSIWMNTGLHGGLNMITALVYGIPGREEAGGLLLIEKGSAATALLPGHVQAIAALVLFVLVFAMYGSLRINTVQEGAGFR
ncbi:CPBP family intramembrane metalloprotease [Paenibacillus sp. N4]|uniref:CPBP family intramembrane glutamic endopeptidase n=1 Tax=Paenibacillus vietnamensis TaxID=2590547 RepID=UPI001CD15E5B|nr:CPBP family intramembrane glutamic endopeptidase [Paenibacillus vietnamensis]MCA0756546.1 CPBP family intramembrane metalloprotease [Paenibacillus vietnamensis]